MPDALSSLWRLLRALLGVVLTFGGGLFLASGLALYAAEAPKDSQAFQVTLGIAFVGLLLGLLTGRKAIRRSGQGAEDASSYIGAFFGGMLVYSAAWYGVDASIHRHGWAGARRVLRTISGHAGLARAGVRPGLRLAALQHAQVRRSGERLKAS